MGLKQEKGEVRDMRASLNSPSSEVNRMSTLISHGPANVIHV